ncbi:MAG: E3 binding domain-containing protein [Bacteroidales bacterium]
MPATPVARALAEEMNIDISLVTGTGPAGRVMKSDIQNFHAPATSVVSAAVKAPSAHAAPADRDQTDVADQEINRPQHVALEAEHST